MKFYEITNHCDLLLYGPPCRAYIYIRIFRGDELSSKTCGTCKITGVFHAVHGRKYSPIPVKPFHSNYGPRRHKLLAPSRALPLRDRCSGFYLTSANNQSHQVRSNNLDVTLTYIMLQLKLESTQATILNSTESNVSWSQFTSGNLSECQIC